MANDAEFTLEEPIDVGFELPEDDAYAAPEEVVSNAYADMVQDIMRKQWDVVNAIDGAVASLSAEEALPFDRDALVSILRKLSDESTVAIGMSSKAMSVVDPSQEELMSKGAEKAEEAAGEASEESSDKPMTESLDDVNSLDFSGEEYYHRYWLEEVKYQIGNMIEENHYYHDDEDETAMALEMLGPDSLRSICYGVMDDILNYDYVWESINECIRDGINERATQFVDEIETVDLEPEGQEGQPEGGEGD